MLVGSSHPFTNYFDVHQGYKVLTQSHFCLASPADRVASLAAGRASGSASVARAAARFPSVGRQGFGRMQVDAGEMCSIYFNITSRFISFHEILVGLVPDSSIGV